MSCDVTTKLDNKQNEILELLTEELCHTQTSLSDDAAYAACLLRDLDNAVIQMQMSYLEGRM